MFCLCSNFIQVGWTRVARGDPMASHLYALGITDKLFRSRWIVQISTARQQYLPGFQCECVKDIIICLRMQCCVCCYVCALFLLAFSRLYLPSLPVRWDTLRCFTWETTLFIPREFTSCGRNILMSSSLVTRVQATCIIVVLLLNLDTFASQNLNIWCMVSVVSSCL